MRTIIQIVVRHDGYVFALCNDSTVWMWAHGSEQWKLYTGSIPQG